jgi:hypothetical protein
MVAKAPSRNPHQFPPQGQKQRTSRVCGSGITDANFAGHQSVQVQPSSSLMCAPDGNHRLLHRAPRPLALLRRSTALQPTFEKVMPVHLQTIEDILEITHLPLLNELEGIDRRRENPFGEWTERRNVSACDARASIRRCQCLPRTSAASAPSNSRRSRRRDAGRRRAAACGRPSDVRRSRAACGICRGSDISAGRTGTGRPAPARDRRKNTPCRKLRPWSQSRRGALPLCRWRGAPNRPPFRRKVCARDRATGQDRDHLRRRDCARRQPLPGNPS